MSFLSRILLASLVTLPLTAETPWNVRDHIPQSEFVIQSHRGAGNLAPENSRETFALAWSLHTIPEADLRTTRDGVIVTFHDKNFARILPNESAERKSQGVEDLTWEELRALDIGAWKGAEFQGQRIPALSEVFIQMKAEPGRRLYIDIKNVDLPALAELAAKAEVTDRLILASTDYDLIKKWKSLAPISQTLHWMGGSEDQLAQRIMALGEVDFAAIDQLQIHVKPTESGYQPSPAFLSGVGAQLREHEVLFQTLPWQSQDEGLYRELLDLGVASFATDFPAFTAQTVKDYYEAKH